MKSKVDGGVEMSNDAEAAAPLHMTQRSINSFLQYEVNNGTSRDCLRQRKTHVIGLYQWLPENKIITKQTLRAWREDLEAKGYAQATILNYVKSVNRYLDYSARPDIRFNRGRAKDLTGKEYGYLTAVENTGEKDRNDYIWRCRCRCGKEVKLPATRLLTGNTLSCGCLYAKHLQRVNLYIDNTSLRSALEERVYSSRASSGYTGVTQKGDKWQAYIRYKGKHYALGCYSKLEDAVKARALGKAYVRKDAEALLAAYEALHRNDAPWPGRNQKQHTVGAAHQVPSGSEKE